MFGIDATCADIDINKYRSELYVHKAAGYINPEEKSLIKRGRTKADNFTSDLFDDDVSPFYYMITSH